MYIDDVGPADKVPGRKWRDPADPWLSKTLKHLKQEGYLTIYTAWLMGGEVEPIKPSDLAAFRGVGVKSIARSLDQLVKSRNRKLDYKVNPDPMTRVYRLLGHYDHPVPLPELGRPDPTHRGELLPCKKCGQIGRYLGTDEKGVMAYVHGTGRGGLVIPSPFDEDEEPIRCLWSSRKRKIDNDGWASEQDWDDVEEI